MGTKDRRKITDTSKIEVGEIDTRSPFQSVKDAVSLFGVVGAFSGGKPAFKKPNPQSAEKALAKETQLHLSQKELNKLKDQLKNAETTKAQALVELEKAKRTVEDLTHKLKSVSESKELAVQETEAAKNQAEKLEEANCDNNNADGISVGGRKHELESARELYFTAITELNSAKQELRQMRLDNNAAIEAKTAAFTQATEAEHAANANLERGGDLQKEITATRESIAQVKIATSQALKEKSTSFMEKDVQKQLHKAALEESAHKLLALKKEFNPENSKNIELQLDETLSEVGALQKMIGNEKNLDLDSVKTVTSELDDAKESLHKVVEEEISLRNAIDSLKLELENVKTEHSELKKKETETETLVGDLHAKLRKSKTELVTAIAEEAKVRGASEEMLTTLQQLTLESENARSEAEDTETKAEELKKEFETTRLVLWEAVEKLRVALVEAEEASADEARALDRIKAMSEVTNAARTSTSETGTQITVSREEFESWSRKVEESNQLAGLKVAAAMAQAEAVKASENEALKRLEIIEKEIEGIKVVTEEALKRAANAEAAKKAVEGELRKWREREQKKAAETASLILAETETVMPSEPSPRHDQIQNQNPRVNNGVRKLEKSKTSLTKKGKVLRPNLSGIFQRKKNQIEGGSPSYLPGEKPV